LPEDFGGPLEIPECVHIESRIYPFHPGSLP
jgi:hypothetical protein